MSKCSFCAEDLDAGLEPCCVAACPVRALDAGDPAELAARHGSADEAAGTAPLPDPALTKPALLMTPHADARRSVEPGTELTPRPPRGLREWSLVAFTLLSQTAAGVALCAGALRVQPLSAAGPGGLDPVLMPLVIGLVSAAVIISLLHLGRPTRAWRSLLNLRSSWLSREVALAALLLGASVLTWGLRTRAGAGATMVGWLDVLAAGGLLAGMARIYMQRTVPVWNHARTPTTFVATALLLGGLATSVALWSLVDLDPESRRRAGLTALTVGVVGATVIRGVMSIGGGDRRGGPHLPVLADAGGVLTGLALTALLALSHGSDSGVAPAILSWLGLTLSTCGQIGLRQDFYADFERVGV